MANDKRNPNVNDGQGRVSAPKTGPDIPVLKKEEKEKPGGAMLQPARVGKQGFFSQLFGGAARSGKAGSGGIEIISKTGAGAAKSGAAKMVGLKGFLGSKIGMAAIGLAVSGAGLIGYGVVSQNAAKKGLKDAQMDLGDISGGVSRRKRSSQGSKSLSFAQRGSKGKLKWRDGKKKVKAASPQSPEKTDTTDAPAGDPGDMAADMMADMMGKQQAERPKLGEGDFGKLSSGSGNSSAFGGKSIFKGGSKFNMKGMSGMTNNVTALGRSKKATRRGARRGRSGRTAKGMSTRRGIGGGKAGAQLRVANRRSLAGSAARTGAGASGMAATAFGTAEASGSMANDLDGIGSGSEGFGGAGGGGGGGGGGGIEPMPPIKRKCSIAEEMTADGFCVPKIEGENVGGEHLDRVIKKFKKQIKSAKKTIKWGWIIFGIGVALIATTGWTGIAAWIGAIIMVIGLGLVYMGNEQKKMAKEQLDEMLDQQEDLKKAAREAAEDEEGMRQEILDKLREDHVDPTLPEARGEPGTHFWHEGDLWKWNDQGKGEKISEDVSFADGSEYKKNADGAFDYWRPDKNGDLRIDYDPDGWQQALEMQSIEDEMERTGKSREEVQNGRWQATCEASGSTWNPDSKYRKCDFPRTMSYGERQAKKQCNDQRQTWYIGPDKEGGHCMTQAELDDPAELERATEAAKEQYEINRLAAEEREAFEARKEACRVAGNRWDGEVCHDDRREIACQIWDMTWDAETQTCNE